MIKHTIISKCEDQEDADAVIKAIDNRLEPYGIYSSVFRNKIKHGTDEESAMYQEVWDELRKYLCDEWFI